MRLFLVLLALCALAGAAMAAPGDGPVHPRVTAVRLRAPVTVDGVLDEEVWREAPAFTEFVMRQPLDDGPSTERTEVRIAFDDDAIYVGARLWDTHPDSIVARLTRRDVDIMADAFVVAFDPYLDRRSGYYFKINAAGTLYDGTYSNDGNSDDSWDGVWSGAARRDDRGWTCEMRIPFSQMRFARAEPQVWGVDFGRMVARKNEEDYLGYPRRKESGLVSRFGDLVGLEGIQPTRSVELLPYVTTKSEYLRHDSGDPFHNHGRYTPDGGLDLRTGLGSRLTLSATVNPDFGQVEVDPAVVNLSDVESYFSEKRPFFVEGSSNFHFGNEGANDYWNFNWPEPTFFYSRRIGRTPQVVASDVDFSDAPVGTRILGAAKVTGKLTPTVNFGTMEALTGREEASYSLGGNRWDAEAEPLTVYSATHALKEFKDRREGLGLMTTVVARDFAGDGLADALNRSSLMIGSDGWWFLDARKTYVISGYTAMSRVEGTPARILALQSSSRHYLQRPDRRHFRIDSTATALTGLVSRYWINKQSGNVLLNCAVGYIDPRFDVNDIGFLSHADVLNSHLGTGYQWTKNNAWQKYSNVLVTAFSSWDADGDRGVSGLWASERTQWANNWNSQVNIDHLFEGLDPRGTRGGPLMVFKPGEEYSLTFTSDPKRPVSYELDGNGSHQTSGSYDVSLSLSAEWKPAPNVTVSIGPGVERTIDDAMWLPGVDDPAMTATYGHRYLFAVMDQRTISANIRLNCAFTPRLTLQLFAQPLISSGRYHDYKELARPGTYDFTHYGAAAAADGDSIRITPAAGAPFAFGEPGFDIKSLRGNAVLRWEYLPGSTVYLVWTQQREDDVRLDAFGVGRSFDRLLQAKASNIFLIKATRYFTL